MKTQYNYTKIDDFYIVLQNTENLQVASYNIKNAYLVKSGKKLVYPNWYELVVHRKFENGIEQNVWVVSERDSGLTIIDYGGMKTRDIAVDRALQYLKEKVKTKAKAISILKGAAIQVRSLKNKWIEESLDE